VLSQNKMNETKKINKNKILAALLFVVIGFVLLQIPVNNLAGTGAKLTFFDMFYPVSGAFIGTGVGVVAVVAMQIFNLVFHGFAGVSTASLLVLLATVRLLPMIAGVVAFSKDSKKVLIIPAVAILAFLATPTGLQAWYFSLLWLIPFAAWPFRKKFLLARSLQTTFVSHSVGGAIWIWAFPTTAAFWTMLIPIVLLERSIFTLGMSASYILMNNLLTIIPIKNLATIDKKYLLKKLSFK